MINQKWFKMGWGLLVLLGTALACALPGLVSKTPTHPAPLQTSTPTEPALIELIPSDTPTMLPPTAAPTGTPTPNPEPWRIPPMPGAIRMGTDQSPELDTKVAATLNSLLREFSIAKPYFFEVYDLPDGTRFADVRTYYNNLIVQAGLNKNQDDMGGNGNGTVVWVDPHNKQHRYAIKYYSATPSFQARIFLIYSIPQ